MVLAPTVNRAKPTESTISGLWLHKVSWRVLDEVLNSKTIHTDLVINLPHRKWKTVD